MEHDVIAALPTVGEADRALLRNYLIKRVGYFLEDAEDPQDFEALDTDTGEIVPFIAWHETIFWLDPDDSTTAHDGITVLVTDDAYRYKANELDIRIRAVLDRDLTSDPTSAVEFGDAYLVPAGSTGDWSGHAEDIAVYTARGWLFREPVIGEWLYVEDEDAYVRYTAAGDWTEGPGSQAFLANTVPVSAIINAARTSFIVENQTTNAPPGSPAVGVAYIIGASPTGLWAGKPVQIAVWETVGAVDWTYYVPTNGFQAYDKALNAPYRYSGTAWISGAGAIIGANKTALTTTGSTTTGGAGTFSYSPTTPPTTSQAYREDSVTLTYQAAKSGARLKFNVVFNSGSTLEYIIALFRDSETTAIGWCSADVASSSQVNLVFELITGDALSHVYKYRLIDGGSGVPGEPTRRVISVEEFA